MANFLKAVVIGLIVTAVLFFLGQHWFGLHIHIDDQIIQPILGLGVMMTLFTIAMVVVGLVLAGIFGSLFFIAVMITALVGAVVLFSSVLFSWPVLLCIVVVWLMVRDQPARCG